MGESGYGYKNFLISAKVGVKGLEVFKDHLIIENLISGLNIIHLKLAYEDRVKIGVTVYDYRL